jgi:hypothetical protein
MEVFDFKTTFMPATEIQERGDRCPKHWEPRDDSIKKWICNPHVIDSFTLLVLRSYQKERQPTPACVKEDTLRFKGSAGEPMIDRFSEVVSYVDNVREVVFTDQIKIALDKAGVAGATHTSKHSSPHPHTHTF